MNMNMSSMTVFLDIGCGLQVDKKDLQPAKLSISDQGVDNSVKNNDILQPDEYQNLLISFYTVPDRRAWIGKILASRSEPESDMIRLLARLKYRYCLQIAVIGLQFGRFNYFGIKNQSLANLVDYYISINCRDMFNRTGVFGIVHEDYFTTCLKLRTLGLWDA